MAVTGDTWLSLSLGQLVPEIDPNNPGSAASLIRDKVNEVEGQLQNTLSSVNGVIAAGSDILAQVGVVASAIQGIQGGINELAQNAGNTGIYFRLIGVCPDFPNSVLRGSQAFANEVDRVLSEDNGTNQKSQLKSEIYAATQNITKLKAELASPKGGRTQEQITEEIQAEESFIQDANAQIIEIDATKDPCVPEFVGDTAVMGGILIVAGAPDPFALWEKLKVFANIFPAIKDAIGSGKEQFNNITDEFAKFKELFSKDKVDQLRGKFDDFKKMMDALGEDPFFNKKKLIQSNGCDKWICSRLKDLMPFLDPNLAGSPLNVALDATNQLTDGVVGMLNRVSALQETAGKLMDAIALLQSDINESKRAIFEFADNLAATGVYIHVIGRDGTIHNNSEFSSAVSNAMMDEDDAGRPTFRGDTAAVAGILLLVGAPDPRGLSNEFAALSGAISGFAPQFKTLTDSAGRVQESLGQLKDSTTTKGVDPAAKVGQTSAQQGGTQSSALNALGIKTSKIEIQPEMSSKIKELSTEQKNLKARLTLMTATASTSSTTTSTAETTVSKVPTAKIVQIDAGHAGEKTITVVPVETDSRFNVPPGPSPVEAPKLEGEEFVPPDSGAPTQGIAPLIRATKRLEQGLV